MLPPPKVIFVHLLNDYSGSPKILSQVISEFESQNQGNVLLTNRTAGFLTKLAVSKEYFFYKNTHNRYLTLIYYLFSQLSIFLRILKYYNQDVVIYVNTMVPFGAGLAGWLLRKKVFYHIHESYITPLTLKAFLRWVIRKSATKVVFVSQSLKNSESFRNIEQFVIYNSLPRELISMGENNEFRCRKSRLFNVLMVCSLKSYKGIYELLQIAEKLVGNPDISFKVVLNSSQKDIDKFFSNVHIPKNVTFLPKQDVIHRFYQQADLVLNLSRVDECVETFGLTILEGITFGLPVIVPPVGGPSEIVTDGIEGYCIDSYKIKEISEKIELLYNKPEIYENLSKNARIRARDFSDLQFKKDILSFLCT